MKVFFSRAMDGREPAEVAVQDREVFDALSKLGMTLVNPYLSIDARRSCVSGISRIVEDDLSILRDADIVIADFSRPNWFYMGSVIEMARAYQCRKPIYAWVGSSGNQKRTWLKHHADGIFQTLGDVQEILRATYDISGRVERHETTEEYYRAIARWYDSTSTTGERIVPPPDARRYAVYRDEVMQFRNWLRQVGVGKVVLDLGSGTGEWVPYWLRTASQVVCIDNSADMLRISRSRNSSDRVEHVRGDILDSPWLVEFLTRWPSIDTVVLGYVLNSLDPGEQRDLLDVLRSSISSEAHLLVFENQWSIFSKPDWYSRTEIQIRGMPESERKFRIYKRNFAEVDLQLVLSMWGATVDVFHSDNYFIGGVASADRCVTRHE